MLLLNAILYMAKTSLAVSPEAAVDCSICLAPFQSNAPRCYRSLLTPISSSRPLALACGHVFHSNCLLEWQSYGGSSCPCCRKPIPASLVQRMRAGFSTAVTGFRLFREELPGMSNAIFGIILSYWAWYRVVLLTHVKSPEGMYVVEPAGSREFTWTILAVAGVLAVRGSRVVASYDLARQVRNLGHHKSLFKAFTLTTGVLGVLMTSASIAQEVGYHGKHSDVVLFALIIFLSGSWSSFFVEFTRAGLQM